MEKQSKPWADAPYFLIETPSKSQDVNSHPAIKIANDMANAHNCMLRGLNAIYHQAPHVKSHVDIVDFLSLTIFWADWILHHHRLEEETMFPGFEAALGQVGLLASTAAQHQGFTQALEDLRQYASSLVDGAGDSAAEYDAKELRLRIEALGPPLREHLADEIPSLLGMRQHCSSDEMAEALMQAFKKAESDAGTQDKFVVPPMVMALHDRTYEGGNSWPAIPGGAVVESVIASELSVNNRGAWRFLPCDHWCKPRPLAFLGE